MPSAISTEEVGESTRESALPWDRIRPVKFGPHPSLAGIIGPLQQMHTSRIVGDADFQSLLKDLDTVEKIRAQKAVSLNLKDRVAEREQSDQERLARENERRKAQGQPPIKALTELDASDPPDPVLAETAQIMADWALLPNGQYAASSTATLKDKTE
jgi:carboxyl-terminal processing protease